MPGFQHPKLQLPDGAIDAHQHSFREVSWLPKGKQPPPNSLEDLAALNRQHKVRGLLIQAENRDPSELGYLLGGRTRHPDAFFGAIVGVDMIQHRDALLESAQQLKAEQGCFGIRFLLEPEHGVLIPGSKGGIREKFVESLGVLSDVGLPFEFCGWNWQHQDMLEVLECPELANLRTMVDHCLKFELNPALGYELTDGFREAVERIAACPQAYVKWSELLKYVGKKGDGSQKWTIEEVAKPMGLMLQQLIAKMGVKRVVWGSGWPVAGWADNVQGSGPGGAVIYQDTVDASLLAMENIEMPQDEVNLIMRDNAIDFCTRP